MPYAPVGKFKPEQGSPAEIRLYHETHSDPTDPALLLVNGYSSQMLLGDMGHDLPEPLWPIIIDAITSHTSPAAA
ncbi:hypothetical protein [Candidatus Poriferisodalis sp.]|uniref:hypothetical protein n=1 Tax=Candidatus Poriferisodalis sp. TaxID=3101277 RepID=UPI003B02A607